MSAHPVVSPDGGPAGAGPLHHKPSHDLPAPDRRETTIVHAAIHNGSQDFNFSELNAEQANAPNTRNERPLHVAAALGRTQMVEQLVQHGQVDPAMRTDDSATAWDAAFFAGVQAADDCMKILENAGLSCSDRVDKFGLTPNAYREMATGAKRSTVVKYSTRWSLEVGTNQFKFLPGLLSNQFETIYRDWKEKGKPEQTFSFQLENSTGKLRLTRDTKNWTVVLSGNGPEHAVRRDLLVEDTLNTRIERLLSEQVPTPQPPELPVTYASARPFNAGTLSFLHQGTVNETAVAVKVPIKNAPKAFDTSLECLKQLRAHPNVLPLLGVETRGTLECPITPYSAFGSLHHLIFASSADIQYDAVDIALQIASAMTFIASKQIHHRNLTSEHVIVFEQDGILICKITGFTCATIGTGSEAERNDLDPAHVAPELIDDPKCASEQSDVYSFSILMWELVHRKKPYPNCRTDFQILRAVKHDGCRPELDQALMEEVPPIQAVLEQAWDQNPQARPPFARLAHALADQACVVQLSDNEDVSSIAMSADDNNVVLGTVAGDVVVMSGPGLPHRQCLATAAFGGQSIHSVATTEDASFVAAASDTKLVLYRLLSNSPQKPQPQTQPQPLVQPQPQQPRHVSAEQPMGLIQPTQPSHPQQQQQQQPQPAAEKKQPAPATTPAATEAKPAPAAQSKPETKKDEEKPKPAPEVSTGPNDAEEDGEDDDEDYDDDDDDEDSWESIADLVDLPYTDGQWNAHTQEGRKRYPVDFLKIIGKFCPHAPKDMADVSSDLRSKRSRVEGLNFLENVPGGYHRPPRRGARAKRVVSLVRDVAPIEKSENRWKPNREEKTNDAFEATLKEALAILNKLTVEKFDKLSTKLIDLGRQLPRPVAIPDDLDAEKKKQLETENEKKTRYLSSFIDRIFTKAIDEPFFCSMYAALCRVMHGAATKDGTPILPEFRRLLLGRCQREFERNRDADENADKAEDKPEQTDAEKAEEDYAAAKQKRHMLGNIKFIGELYKNNLLRVDVVHKECIQRLLDSAEKKHEEDVIECLCKLIQTCGERLDSDPDGVKKMDEYMARLEKLSSGKSIPSRIKFMILDVLDLRKDGWVARREQAGPKTISEIHEQAARKSTADERPRGGGGGGKGDRRKSSARGPNKVEPEWKTVSQSPRATNIDRSRLGKLSNSTPEHLGPPRPFGKAAGGDRGRDERQVKNAFALLDEGDDASASSPTASGAGDAEEAVIDDKTREKIESEVKSTLNEYYELGDTNEVKECLALLESPFAYVQLAKHVFSEAGDHEKNLSKIETLIEVLAKDNLLTADAFTEGFDACLGMLYDQHYDYPHIVQITAQLLAKGASCDLFSAASLDPSKEVEPDGKLDSFSFPGTFFLEIVVQYLAAVHEKLGAEGVRKAFKELPCPLSKMQVVNPDREVPEFTASQVYEVIAKKKKDYSFIVDLSEDEKAEIKKLVLAEAPKKEIMELVSNALTEEQRQFPPFVQSLATCIISAIKEMTIGSDYDDKEAPEEIITKESKLAVDYSHVFKKYINPWVTGEKKTDGNVFVFEVFETVVKDAHPVFPKDFLDRWFWVLYEHVLDNDEDIFLAWKKELQEGKRQVPAQKTVLEQHLKSFFDTLEEDGDDE
eukprot:m.79697 g.79697  ORF g.79697 m.79697 type:complete len:1630 (+) comp8190_c3_seq1:211-5100(+)